jgi:ribosomal protein S18 acetylase RimI-like enzyme
MLRQATENDAGRVARLHIASWQVTYVRELPASFLAALNLVERTASWRTQLQHGATVVVAEDAGELTGFVACGPARDEESERGTWEIYNLHVDPARHGQGIGSALFNRAVFLGRERDATQLVLWVVVTNSAARRFYELKRMVPDGAQQEQAVGNGHVLREVRYRMKLSN